MKKSLIALLLVVALVVTVSVFAVSAEETNPFAEADGEDVTAICPVCGTEEIWKAVPKDVYEAGNQMQNWELVKNGATHFYFAENMNAATESILTTEKICLNLNGMTITRTGKTGWFYVAGVDAETAPVLSILDTSVDGSGVVDCGTIAGKGFFTATGTGTVNVYGGTFYAYGSRMEAGSSDNPTLVNADDSAAAATFNFYGGTLKGYSKYTAGLMRIDGSTVVNIDGATLDGKGGTNTVKVENANAKLYLKSGSLTGASMSAGKDGCAVVVEGGAYFEMTGGTLTGTNTSTSAFGGAIRVSNGSAVLKGGTITGSAVEGGAIYATGSSSSVLLDGVTIKNSSSTVTTGNQHGGGAVLVKSGATVTMKSGTIENCTAASEGGAVNASGGTFDMQGGTIKNCSAARGGAMFASGSIGKVLISGNALIQECSATDKGGAMFIQYQSKGSKISGGTIQNCSAVRGGAVSIGGTGTETNGFPTLTMEGGLIENCTATTHGGAVYAERMGIFNMENGTIKDCEAETKGGGGVALCASHPSEIPKFNMTGGTISGCDAATYGGNVALGLSEDDLEIDTIPEFVMSDGAVLDGRGAVVSGNGSKGENIGIACGEVTINGGKLINGEIYMAPNAKATLNLNGGEYTTTADRLDVRNWSRIFIQGLPSNIAGTITMGKNLAADFCIDYWANEEVADDYKVGTVLDIALEEGFAGDLNVFVYDKEGATHPAAVSEGKLILTGMAGVTAEGVEIPITALPTDNTYAYVKLFSGFEALTLVKDEIIDQNNMGVHFVTGDKKLTVVNYHNNNGSLDTDDKFFTVDEPTNLVNLTEAGRNPVDNKQYIIIPEDNNKYSAHHVKVDVDSVSIKPASASLYYNTNLLTNSKVAENALDYGVVLSLVEMPGADFVAGKKGEVYTCLEDFKYGEDDRISMTTQSCLLTGILPEVTITQGGLETTSGKAKIYATAYMTIRIDGQPVCVMADKSHQLSLYDIMRIVDETDPSNPSVLKMYEKYQTPLADWKLTHIQAAYEASKA